MNAWDDQPLSIDDTLSVYERMWDDDEWDVDAWLRKLHREAAYVRTGLIVLAIVALIVLASLVAPTGGK